MRRRVQIHMVGRGGICRDWTTGRNRGKWKTATVKCLWESYILREFYIHKWQPILAFLNAVALCLRRFLTSLV
jgi:hypothetical protein